MVLCKEVVDLWVLSRANMNSSITNRFVNSHSKFLQDNPLLKSHYESALLAQKVQGACQTHEKVWARSKFEPYLAIAQNIMGPQTLEHALYRKIGGPPPLDHTWSLQVSNWQRNLLFEDCRAQSVLMLAKIPGIVRSSARSKKPIWMCIPRGTIPIEFGSIFRKAFGGIF